MKDEEIHVLKADLQLAAQEASRQFMVAAKKMIDAEDGTKRDLFFQEAMRHLAQASCLLAEWRLRIATANDNKTVVRS